MSAIGPGLTTGFGAVVVAATIASGKVQTWVFISWVGIAVMWSWTAWRRS